MKTLLVIATLFVAMSVSTAEATAVRLGFSRRPVRNRVVVRSNFRDNFVREQVIIERVHRGQVQVRETIILNDGTVVERIRVR
jgi:archaellum component FlaF (FlaF/FlaG flagellin family)